MAVKESEFVRNAKDVVEKNLEDFSDVQADLVNVLIFDGERKVKPIDLENSGLRSFYKADGRIREQERDGGKYWRKDGVRIAFIGVENMTNAENDMPVRIIGYDGASYRNQIVAYKENADHGKRRGLERKKQPKQQVFPVVTMVLYFDPKKKWNKAKSLYECFGEMPENLKKVVSDYHINVYDIAWLADEQVECFQSDFKVLADYFTQMRKTGDYVPKKIRMSHSREVLRAMKVLTGDDRFEIACNEGKGDEKYMCEVLDRIENRGIQKGRKQGRRQGRRQGLQFATVQFVENAMDSFHISAEQACEKLGCTFEDYLQAKKCLENFRENKPEKK